MYDKILLIKFLVRKMDSMHKNMVKFSRNMQTFNKSKMKKLQITK